MENEGALATVVLLLVLSAVGLAAAPRRGRLGDAGSLVTEWFVLTVVTLWCGLLVAFVVDNLLLFMLGTGAATIGVIGSAIFLVATPVVWAVVIRRRARRPSSDT